MTIEELIEKLDGLPAYQDGGDNEAAHVNADKWLIQYLMENGQTQAAEAWQRTSDRIGFWYS